MRAVPRFALAVLLVAFISCGKDSTAPDEPGPPSDVHGTWTFAEELYADAAVCENTGSIDFSQADADLRGSASRQGACYSQTQTVDDSRTGSVSGNVGQYSIRFSFGGCSYKGYLAHLPVDSAGGTVECEPHLGAANSNAKGLWSAQLQVPPPNLHGSMILPTADTMVVTGETVRIAIEASDPRGLRMIGYDLVRWDPIPATYVSDSFVVNDTSVVDTIARTIPGTWEGAWSLDVWARNAYGKARGERLPGFRVFDGVRHPIQTITLDARAADVAYDAARNLLYLTEPESARVAVLSLGSFSFGASIPLPMVKANLDLQSIDLVPGGDTVIVALPDTSRLALLNRVANTLTTSHVTGATGINQLRVTANRKVFSIGQVDSGGVVFFAVIERNLATGADSIRRDLGHVNAGATLWGSPDHSKLLVLSQGAPSCGYLYDAATDAFSACSALAFDARTFASATTSGDRWIVWDKLLDGSLNVLATLEPGGDGISPDGSVAYVGTFQGYNKIALPSGAVLEKVRVPGLVAQPVRITVFPDGTRLLLWNDWLQAFNFGTRMVTVVDLTH